MLYSFLNYWGMSQNKQQSLQVTITADSTKQVWVWHCRHRRGYNVNNAIRDLNVLLENQAAPHSNA
jgi:hypothetical protein